MTNRDAIKVVRAIYRADSGLELAVEELHRQFPDTDWQSLWHREQTLARRREERRSREYYKTHPKSDTVQTLQEAWDKASAHIKEMLARNLYEPQPSWARLRMGVTPHGKDSEASGEQAADQEAEGRR